MPNPKLDPKKLKQSMEAPDEFADRMKQEGKEDELSTDDKLRATTSRAVKGFAKMIGFGKKKK